MIIPAKFSNDSELKSYMEYRKKIGENHRVAFVDSDGYGSTAVIAVGHSSIGLTPHLMYGHLSKVVWPITALCDSTTLRSWSVSAAQDAGAFAWQYIAELDLAKNGYDFGVDNRNVFADYDDLVQLFHAIVAISAAAVRPGGKFATDHALDIGTDGAKRAGEIFEALLKEQQNSSQDPTTSTDKVEDDDPFGDERDDVESELAEMRGELATGSTVLDEAGKIIAGDRRKTYGKSRESFGRIAQFWSSYLGIEVSPIDVANLMILMKVSRSKGKFHRDSFVDICGYAALTEELK